MESFNPKLHLPILIFGIGAPFVIPGVTIQIAVLWVMVLFALTWDIMGGQMGYNSLGNILFFGSGMYISALVQISMFANVSEYTASSGAVDFSYTNSGAWDGEFWPRASAQPCWRRPLVGPCSVCAGLISPSAPSASR